MKQTLTEFTGHRVRVALVIGWNCDSADEDGPTIGSSPQGWRVVLAVDQERVGEIQVSDHGRHGVVDRASLDGSLYAARSFR